MVCSAEKLATENSDKNNAKIMSIFILITNITAIITKVLACQIAQYLENSNKNKSSLAQ